jgi:alkanesulfonate monooxygenase SsuD/methylene tetrahydromethanopterin reductase-like flavin-dependent oxidoreductase (luciferase family)
LAAAASGACIDGSDEWAAFHAFNLLSSKPTVFVANVAEDQLGAPDSPPLERLRAIAARGVTGTPDRVKAGLQRKAADYEADEVTVLTITHDFAARVRSYELIARAFGLCG